MLQRSEFQAFEFRRKISGRVKVFAGVLRKYERLAPKDIGLPKIDVPAEQLRQGEPLLKKINLPGGFTRSVRGVRKDGMRRGFSCKAI